LHVLEDLPGDRHRVGSRVIDGSGSRISDHGEVEPRDAAARGAHVPADGRTRTDWRPGVSIEKARRTDDVANPAAGNAHVDSGSANGDEPGARAIGTARVRAGRAWGRAIRFAGESSAFVTRAAVGGHSATWAWVRQGTGIVNCGGGIAEAAFASARARQDAMNQQQEARQNPQMGRRSSHWIGVE